MLAAVLYEVDKLVLEERPTPTPKPDEAVVRIKSCGICATDYKAIKGIRKNVRFPLVPGHEPAGIVAAVGAHVRSVKEGDEVIVCPSGHCGYCRYCLMGKEHYCERMYTTGGDGPDDVRPGSFAEYTVTGANSLYGIGAPGCAYHHSSGCFCVVGEYDRTGERQAAHHTNHLRHRLRRGAEHH